MRKKSKKTKTPGPKVNEAWDDKNALAWAIVREIEARIGSGISPLDWNVREARQAMLERWVRSVEEVLK